MYAWGYNEKDPATNLVFTSKGGISDWGGILLGLQDRGILPPAETNETAEQVDANTEKAKSIVLNNQDTNLESIQESAELDLITTEGYDILRANDFTDEKLQSMSVKEINDKLIELAPKSAEPELTEEQLAGIPDDLKFQDTFTDLIGNESLKSLESIENESNKGNNVVDLSKFFKHQPTVQEVKKFIENIAKENKIYDTLSNDWKIDIRNDKKTIKHIIYSDRALTMSTAEKKRHNKYVMAFEQIVNNSEYLFSEKNKKLEKKPDVQNYHYFKTEVKIGKKNYILIMDTEEFYTDPKKKPRIVHLYNIKEPLVDQQGWLDTGGSYGSILDHLNDDVKKKLEDFQQDKKVKEKNNNLQLQNNQVGKGGAYDPTTRSITLGGKADATTLPHELAPKSAEPELTEEQLAGIPDDLPFHDDEQFDMANENARLDDIYPEYKGETINIDGKERTVYNSNGDRIAKSEPALRNFYKWFGDSKVVDEQGRPLVVYHKTSAEFDTFDTKYTKQQNGRSGFFFSKDILSSFGKYTMPIYLKMENVLEIDAKSHDWFDLPLSEAILKDTQGITSTDAISGYAKNNGYDGVIIKNIIEGDNNRTKTDDYIVFNEPKFAPTEQEKQTFLSDLESKQTIRLGKLPSVYQNIGIESADVKTKQTTIEKATIKKHAVPDDTVKQLPELFANPQIVFKSLDTSTNPNAYIAVVDAFDKDGKQMIIALSPTNKTGGYHLITSFYGRDNIQNMIDNAVSKNKIKYVRDKNIDLLAGHNAYLSQVENNIKYKNDIVNSQIKSVNNRGTYSPDTGNIYLQTAYAGSRVDYDRPSLEAIGSGEGNQAHGWGLYYALNKDVADNYRIVFTRQGQYDLAHRKLYSEHLWGTSRKETIQNLLEEIKEAQRRYKENDYFQTRGNTKESWKNYINDLIGALEIIQDENLTYNNFEHKDGQVHEVDIPEMDVLLDEQKTFDKQPQFVQETIKKVLKETDERLLNDLTNERTGGYIYEGLSYILGSDKQASQLLDKYGIKGITYNGREDGRCFVIFNENSVKVLRKKFDKLGNVQFQNNQVGKGGAYDPTTRSITLGGKADATTLPHELAHYWIDKNFKWARSGKASQEWKRQWQAVEKWLGIDPEDKVLSKQASEKFARAYEKFLGEEKAPLVLEKKKHHDNIVVI